MTHKTKTKTTTLRYVVVPSTEANKPDKTAPWRERLFWILEHPLYLSRCRFEDRDLICRICFSPEFRDLVDLSESQVAWHEGIAARFDIADPNLNHIRRHGRKTIAQLKYMAKHPERNWSDLGPGFEQYV